MNSDKYFFDKIFNLKYHKDVDETIYYDEECISKCYPKNTLFYDIMDGKPYLFNKDKCTLLLKTKEGETTKDCKTNNYVNNINDEDNLLNILIYNSYSYFNNI